MLTLGLLACGQSASLENTIWVLESYGEPGKLHAVLEDTEVTATFDSVEGKVTGSAGCNNYFSGYEVKDNELLIPGPIGATKMSCGEQIDKQEYEYLTTLETSESYQVEGDKLTITCGNNILIFKRK